jgi:DUF4097 and DUF4098 domain-containing protein YvlB
MPSFETPGPISASVNLVLGDLRVTTGARTDTVVEVRPGNGNDALDVRAAADTQVDFGSGRLVVRGPRNPTLGLFGKVGAVIVTIDMPAGSDLDGRISVGSARCTGQLGDCRLKTSAGDLQVQDAATLTLNTAMGVAIAETVTGDATVTSGSGKVAVRSVGGHATLKNGNGETWIGAAHGELRINSANGTIAADHAAASVTANTACGDIRIGDLVRGSATLRSAAGRIAVGIRSGTAALLDLHTSFGNVRNDLDAASGPADTDEKAEVRARTAFGDIVIHRA